MRKEYGKVLKRAFSACMKEIAPHFREIKVKSAHFWPGDRAYGWRINENVLCWIVLNPSQKDYDEFTILIGWSSRGRYPELSMVPCPEGPTAERGEFEKEEYLTRLPFLWSNEDKWWVIRQFAAPQSVDDLLAKMAPISDEEAERQVTPVVDDAIKKIAEIGLPYLAEYVAFANRGRSERQQEGHLS
ncbi:MAG: hypothetical protein QUT30_15120 [Acidobacteriota bacterium]|jgi:hypothetical protein|nr:hypothetical protein [Acidobacteriota bacterium]